MREKTTEYEIMNNYLTETLFMIEINDVVEYEGRKYTVNDIQNNLIGEVLCSLVPISFRDTYQTDVPYEKLRLIHKAKKTQGNCECGQWIVKGFNQGPWHSDYCPLYKRQT